MLIGWWVQCARQGGFELQEITTPQPVLTISIILSYVASAYTCFRPCALVELSLPTNEGRPREAPSKDQSFALLSSNGLEARRHAPLGNLASCAAGSLPISPRDALSNALNTRRPGPRVSGVIFWGGAVRTLPLLSGPFGAIHGMGEKCSRANGGCWGCVWIWGMLRLRNVNLNCSIRNCSQIVTTEASCVAHFVIHHFNLSKRYT